jgi:thioredoxin 1
MILNLKGNDMIQSRRHFLGLGLAVLPMLAGRAFASPVQISPEKVQDLQAAGKSIFVDFKADWCSTCKAQEKVINAILADDPALEQSIVFVQIDWDVYGEDAFTKGLKIPRRSTLVKFNGMIEAGRLVAQTDRAQIEALIRA